MTNDHITIGYDEQHRAALMPDQPSTLVHDVGHIIQTFCTMQSKSWRVMLEKVKAKVCNYLSALMVEKSQYVLQKFASQLSLDTRIEVVGPLDNAGFLILTETLDQTLDQRPGKYCKGMPISKTPGPLHPCSQRALTSSGLRLLPGFDALSTSKLIHLEQT
ncbi:hypothetical protein C1H46_041960 [Malus baccata]|uniref:Uncharacterized protein n=1 Tax=Malus baccata TaxID=106549 RepID=A0A540KE49_MALBA|nr:hypothetical protein C1H46_041960 [Malus baccata]